VAPEVFKGYTWQGRTVERQRAEIRHHLGYREATVQGDAVDLLDQLHQGRHCRLQIYLW
jgi:hypothetical protein